MHSACKPSPEGAQFCIYCGAPLAATGETQRLERRPLLGMFRGEPVYEYDRELWGHPEFVPAPPIWIVRDV